LVARAIHDFGARVDKPFVAINMACDPARIDRIRTVRQERGAFTGAQARTSGRFEQAQGGTLFLGRDRRHADGGADALLRVLQAAKFTTVGGARSIRADVRIIAATHKDLPKLIADGAFA
jgi:two-component system nitrogen regulation response regulator GlnG